MKKEVVRFLRDLDGALVPHAQGQRLTLYHFGRSSLAWEYDYGVSTDDIDIFQPKGDSPLLTIAIRLYGKDSGKHKQLGLYLDVVSDALPPAPWHYAERAIRCEVDLQVIDLYRLDPHDLIATKLRRFAPKDREDIVTLCDRGHINAQKLEHVLQDAFPFNLEKDGDEYRDSAFRNLKIVQAYLNGQIASL